MSKKEKRSIGLNRDSMWPFWIDNGERKVEVPYVADLDPEINELFLDMVKLIEASSCVRWVPRTYQKQFVWVNSTVPPGWHANLCAASIGMGPADTFIYISRQCLGLSPYGPPKLYRLAHEMFHTLNFANEHQRRDRDCFISVPEDLQDKDPHRYGIYTNQDTDISYPYDEESIMHYPDSELRRKQNELPTYKSHIPSYLDWNKLNVYYCRGQHFCKESKDATLLCLLHRQLQRKCLRYQG